ncbi:putative Zinc finger-containing ubiquitin peptidase 1 [Blattamonas nauphoetae]|uniref:Zinc finger-containing ubiquitin peptidase 1 n=1 Tax=Blattamonas nauphoetae TaxID=2049346 RepID=A0ABQ9WV99_9EUKA|nr:putative Zinc finger-containing ubiquitin peptidase 1 [Blattamonas nauphoetae]
MWQTWGFQPQQNDDAPLQDPDPYVDDGVSQLRAYLSNHPQTSYRVNSILSLPTDYVHVGYDLGWGCGYRNTAMMYSCVRRLPAFQQHFRTYGFPDHLTLQNVQEIMEMSWKAGFDPDGKNQLQGKVYGRSKWIGATDVWSFFHFLRVPMKIVDVQSGADNLIKWITNYFLERATGDKMVTVGTGPPRPFCPPLYLQGHDHSLTIVGVVPDEEVLIVFDPSDPQQFENIPAFHHCEGSLFRRRSTLARFSQLYQILYLDTDSLLPEETTELDKRVSATLV